MMLSLTTIGPRRNLSRWRFLRMGMIVVFGASDNLVYLLLLGGSAVVVADPLAIDILELVLVLVVQGEDALENVLRK